MNMMIPKKWVFRIMHRWPASFITRWATGYAVKKKWV